MIVWKFAWVDIALVVLDEWSPYRGGRLNRFDCNWKEIEILAIGNNIVKQKFKEIVSISQEKNSNLLNKNEGRKVTSDINSAMVKFFIRYGQIISFLIVNRKVL